MLNGKKAIVLSIVSDTKEIKDLSKSLGYDVVKTFIQNRKNPDVNLFLGTGKIDEIKDFIQDSSEEIDLVLVNGELKPSQWFNLEKIFKVNVFDRINLILNIFEKRADRKEARLQVKLAQLQYQRSFVRELIHRARAGEHPGFMAGGEYQVDDYYENLKKQMKKIKKNLDSFRNERKLRRRHRHLSGFYLVSLSGYTNAGKSSILNLLSDEEVKVENKLFSTLSTTTRKINNINIPILLTDTVGFIENLPALIVDAFHSTLEEIKVADLVILVVDFSEDLSVLKNKLNVSLNELIDLGVESPIILALNKVDLLPKSDVFEKLDKIKSFPICNDKKIVTISAKKKMNIDNLINVIYDSLPKLERHSVRLPMNSKSQFLVSKIYEKANVYDINYGDFVTLSFECNKDIADKFLSDCKSMDGSILK